MRRKRKKKFRNRKHHKNEPPRHDYKEPVPNKKKKRKRGGKSREPDPKTLVDDRTSVFTEPVEQILTAEDTGPDVCKTCGSVEIYATWPDPMCVEHWAEWKALSQFWKDQEEVKQSILARIREEEAEKVNNE